MPAGVTQFSNKIKPVYNTNSVTDGRFSEVSYGPFDMAQVLVQATSVGMSVVQTQVGGTNKGYIATGDGSSTSNIAGVAVATTDVLDFTMRIPANFETLTTSYVDIYYFLTGAGTKGDVVRWTGAYRNISVNATTTALATCGTTTNLTNPTARTLATSKSNGYMYKDTITVAPSTFTADTLPQFRITAGGTYTQPELRVTKIVHRFARSFM